nr:MaoC family dehydratase N-terminal domain-containing protein [Gordonia soli]
MGESDAGIAALKSSIEGWHPTPTIEDDPLDPRQANRLAATLDLDGTYSAGDELPVPWQWVFFPDWPPTAALGADGHPEHGHFLPPIPHRRRMFAGSTMTVTRPLRLGGVTEKRSGVERLEIKHGRSGAMLFVTVRSEYRQDGDLCVTEDQTIVYRSDRSASRPYRRAEADLVTGDAPWSAEPAPEATTLFRYSALTSNSHRIHYDRPYVSDVEGYPDIVVHGPLLATYLADLARLRGRRQLREFTFRLTRPIFLGDRFRAEARPDGDTVTMRVVTGDGIEHVRATGRFG